MSCGTTHHQGCPCHEARRGAEVQRLRDGIRAKAEWWDANRPDAPAFEVTGDFRALLEENHDDR